MPGTNAGTGCPIVFKCNRGRQGGRMSHSVHYVRVTDRERRASTNKNMRMDAVIREYVCSCGHRGWSRHIDLANRNWYPLVQA